MAKIRSFELESSLTLVLENIQAKVTIETHDSQSVFMDADDKDISEKIDMSQLGDRITIKGSAENEQGISPTPRVSHGNISIYGDAINNIIITGIPASVGDTKAPSHNMGTKKIPRIKILVPAGTDLEVDGVHKLHSLGLGGKIKIILKGEEFAYVRNANDIELKCRGKASCVIETASGDLDLTASGRSKIFIEGTFGDIKAESNTLGQISIEDDYHDFKGQSHDESQIKVIGRCGATGETKKTSFDQSNIEMKLRDK